MSEVAATLRGMGAHRALAGELAFEQIYELHFDFVCGAISAV